MKPLDQYISKCNKPENLLVITNYPPSGEGVHTAKIGGVTGFAKNTLVPLAKLYTKEDRKIIVLADILDKPRTYEEDGVLIMRCWKRNRLLLYAQLLVALVQFRNVQDILVEFEFASFGDFWITAFFPAFLLLLRLLGRRVTIVLHQVITDLWSLIGHLGLQYDSRKYRLLSQLLPLYYALLTRSTNHTVVLEDIFCQRLTRLAPKNKISVISHGVEDVTRIPTKMHSRKLLGWDPREFIVLSFGFITWYKGTDTLIKSLDEPMTLDGKSIRLVVAGGPSTTQKHKTHYQTFYDSVKTLAKGKKHITLTGFVPNDKIPLYFAAADAVIFPYRTVMSSSGPLSLALAYRKPILLSTAMEPILSTHDIKTALGEARLSRRTLLVRDISKLPIHLKQTMRNKKPMKHFIDFLATKRSFTNLAVSYYAMLNSAEVCALDIRLRPALG